jgi:hypothetical protein
MANANLFQQYLQPARSVIDYSNDYAKADALRNQNAMQSLALQQQASSTAQSLAERNALQRIAAGWNADTTPDQRAAALRNSGLPGLMSQADALDQTQAKLLDSRANVAEKSATAFKTTQDTAITAHQQHLQALSMVNTPEDAVQWMVQGVKEGTLKADNLPGALQTLQTKGLDGWKQGAMASGQTVQQQLEMTAAKPTEVRLGNVVKTIDTNPRSQTFGKEIIGAQQIGVSPDTAANNATSTANNRANIAKDFAVAGLDANGNAANGTGLLDEATIANAAARYNTDGTLPPNLGRGQQGPREIASILKEAAAQAAARGDTPEAQRVAQLSNKANAAALNKLQTQQTMVGAFEKNFTKNADMAEQLSGAVDRTGIPLVNKWVNAGKRAVTGDPDLSAFDASVKATVNEYAKIVSGATGGAGAAQGEISKIEGLLNAAQTPDQVKAVLGLMRKETQNRMAAFDDEKAQLTSSMTMPKTRAPAPAAGGAVPPDIAAILAKHGGK